MKTKTEIQNNNKAKAEADADEQQQQQQQQLLYHRKKPCFYDGESSNSRQRVWRWGFLKMPQVFVFYEITKNAKLLDLQPDKHCL